MPFFKESALQALAIAKKYAKNYVLYIALSVALFCIGVFLFFIKRHWLIIHWVPGYERSEDISRTLSKKVSPKRDVTLYYWSDGEVKKEPLTFVACLSKAQNIKLIVGNWLSFLYEERILEKRVGIESVLLASSGQVAYLSFDRALVKREWSIRKKWFVFDGLCKTVSRSRLGVQFIVFLVNNEQMCDEHLEFSRPWPVDGFG